MYSMSTTAGGKQSGTSGDLQYMDYRRLVDGTAGKQSGTSSNVFLQHMDYRGGSFFGYEDSDWEAEDDEAFFDEETELLIGAMDTFELKVRLEMVGHLRDLQEVEEEIRDTLAGVREALNEDGRPEMLERRYQEWKSEVETLGRDRREELLRQPQHSHSQQPQSRFDRTVQRKNRRAKRR